MLKTKQNLTFLGLMVILMLSSLTSVMTSVAGASNDTDLTTNTTERSYIKTIKTFNGPLIWEGFEGNNHYFSIPDETIKVYVTLKMPGCADFDLSLWNGAGKRTGGKLRGSSENQPILPTNNIPGASYSPGVGKDEKVNVENPSTADPRFHARVFAWRGAGTYTITVKAKLPGNGVVEKIGVLLWATDLTTRSAMESYKSVLENVYGYSKFFMYENHHDYENIFKIIDDYESSEDIIFVIIAAHGRYCHDTNFRDSESRVRLDKNNPGIELSSAKFRRLMDTLEAKYKGFIVDSCQSGGFVDDFSDAKNYLGMSSSRYSETSYYFESNHPWFPRQGKFTTAFLWYSTTHTDDKSTFDAASKYVSSQHARIIDTTGSFNFFGKS